MLTNKVNTAWWNSMTNIIKQTNTKNYKSKLKEKSATNTTSTIYCK